MTHLGKLCAALLTAAALVACSSGAPKAPAPAPVEVTISAAASLTDALKEIQTAFEAEHKSTKLRMNFGSSGALQQQIEQGAPVDLFISAATSNMDALGKKGVVEQSAVQPLVSNTVVLIRSKAGEPAVAGWEHLKADKVKRIAIGNPEHVPAGKYGKAVLEKLNLWEGVQPKLVLGEDVRGVLTYVESGEVQAGIVYRTDAAVSQKVVVVAEAPAGSHAPVVYPMAVVKDAKHGAEAKEFADYLKSEAGMKVLEKFGFTAAK